MAYAHTPGLHDVSLINQGTCQYSMGLEPQIQDSELWIQNPDAGTGMMLGLKLVEQVTAPMIRLGGWQHIR